MNKKVISGIVILGLASSYIGAKIYATNVVEENLNSKIANARLFATITYDDISVSPLSGSVEISDVVIIPRNVRNQEITIDNILIKDIDTKSPAPTYLNIELEGIKLDIEQLGRMGRQIKEELALQGSEVFNLATQYEYSDNEFDWELTLSVDNLAAVNYSIELANVDFDPQQPAVLLFNYQNILLTSAQFNYTDDSLAEKIFEREAAKQNISVSELKEETIQSMNHKIAGIKEKQADSTAEKQAENEFIIDVLEEFVDFTADPDGFKISINTKEPVTLGELQQLKRSPGKLLSKLDMAFEAK